MDLYYLSQIVAQKKQFDALYREAGARFGLSDCTMWVLYFLISSDEPITQQDLVEKMRFPKQTINSAVVKLEKEGFLELYTIPTAGNRKTITLTQKGRDLTNKTVRRILRAELQAANNMGTERISQFMCLYTELFEAIKEEFEKEDLRQGQKSQLFPPGDNL